MFGGWNAEAITVESRGDENTEKKKKCLFPILVNKKTNWDKM